MKTRIVQMLRTNPEAISGERLSRELGITRVAVWKHIRGLQHSGYRIEASTRGYRLVEEPDTPFPWEFPARSDRMHYYPEVSSTMDLAREMARRGCPAMTVVVAGRQQHGRGRLDRRWVSGDGGLYLTVVLRPLLPPALGAHVIFCASLSLAQVLDRHCAVEAAVKWPNDILVAERKIAGILSEMEAETDRISHLNVGIGLNVNNDPGPANSAAVSLRQLLGRKVSRKALLAAFLDDFQNRLETGSSPEWVAEWKRRCVTLGREVEVVTHRQTVKGRAVDVDETGSLVLQAAGGGLRTIRYGDCFHR